MGNISIEEKDRLAKIAVLQKNKINPYPAKTKLFINIVKALEADEQTKVSIHGRLISKRVMGKLCFAHLKDGSGKIQLAFSQDKLGKDSFKLFIKNFDTADFVEVTGEVFITHKGEKSVLVSEYNLLSKALLPLPEKWHGLTDIESRYRQRYLDLLANNKAMHIAKVRSVIVKKIRNYFDNLGFYEIETPILQSLYGGALAKPFVTHHNALDIDLYLRIAPELYLKRLLVGGFEKVYEIARCFRNEGVDNNHNPEFTQIEFYWAYANYNDLMDIMEDLLPKIIKSAGLDLKFKVGEQEVDFTPPYPRITMRQLILNYAKIDIEDYPTQEAILAKAKKLKVEDVDQTSGRGKIIDEIYKVYVRPHIVNPIFMIDHPVELSPLAKQKPVDSRYVERVQLLCVGGNELCNGFSELNDPIEQENRFKEQKRLSDAGDDESMPYDEDFVIALKHGMPPTAGLGMGIDRLIKLLTDSDNLKEVILFPTLKNNNIKKASSVKLKNSLSSSSSKLPMNRAQAWDLVKKYNFKESNLNHYLESEVVMRTLAKKLGQDKEYWGMLGLLHDIDWELTKDDINKHLTKAPELLRKAGFDDEFIQIVLSHGYGTPCANLQDKKRSSAVEYALACAETITGLVYSASLMRPDKIVSLNAKSLKKKFKDKKFASTINRDIIKECEQLGLELDEFLQLSIDAIKTIADKIGLN